jgi:hypothetical protein
MTKTIASAALLALSLSLSACTGGEGESDTNTTNTTNGTDDCVDGAEVTADITEDTTWSCDVVLGAIVTVKGNATLTIEPGVTVRGKSGSALVIDQGSKLIAEGTEDAPIVLTSSQAPGARSRGDWGGLVLLGDAPINLAGGTGIAEGFQGEVKYGGSDPTSSCGSLKYLRVEFAGFELTTDNELNAITFYGCGSGTVVDHVQTHMGDDDGFEMFGGGFDASHLVASGIGDDSLDLDQGFSGKLQHIFIHQDPADGNYAFEISNQDVNLDATPRTAPMIANVTAVGGDSPKSAALKLKEGAAGVFHNMIITNFNGAQVDLTETQTEDQAATGEIVIKNSLFFGNNRGGSGLYIVSEASTFDLQGFVEDAANGNLFDVDPKLGSAAWGAPNIIPAAGSPALNGVRPPADFTGEPSDFIGAVKDEASDFTQGWTNYAPN